ncbi:MAG: ABC transporter ATP-binding protein [Alphaproteobacteria bacterium]|nr:ABC transporter ATP-binding protein [Alphaproteobacteria bacterium]
MLLAVLFFCLIFSSLLWLFLSIGFVLDSLSGISFFDAGIANIILYSLLVCLPIYFIWAVFGYINQYVHNRTVDTRLQLLLKQSKRNQDYSDLIARALIEAEQRITDGFVLSKVDLLLLDINELLSEIIRGCKLASPEQIENLWTKVQHGGKWSFGKVIIEINNSQSDFKKRILDKCLSDAFLGGTVLEFCARYDAVVKILEKHDKDRLFLDIMETGVMGKVFSILFPIAADINKGRSIVVAQKEDVVPETSMEPVIEKEEPEDKEGEGDSFLSKINVFKNNKKEEDEVYQPELRDPFSIALERSFAEETPLNEPTISAQAAEIEVSQEVTTSMPDIELTNTQKTLASLQEEWKEYSPEAEKTEPEPAKTEENLIYPFAGWSNEENYNK